MLGLGCRISLSVSVALNIATAAPNTPLDPLPSAATTDIALASSVCWSDDGVLCASEKVAAGDKLLTWSSVLSAAVRRSVSGRRCRAATSPTG